MIVRPSFCEFSLKVESTYPRQPDIEHEARLDIRNFVLQEVGCRAERLNLQAHRSQQTLDRFAQRCVIVDNENDRLWLRLPLHNTPPRSPAVGTARSAAIFAKNAFTSEPKTNTAPYLSQHPVPALAKCDRAEVFVAAIAKQ